MDRRAPASDRNVKNCNALEGSLPFSPAFCRNRKAASTSLRLVAVLDVRFKHASARRPWRLVARVAPPALLTRLATKPGEKSRLDCARGGLSRGALDDRPVTT
jgi:hypothetical protein